MDRSNEPLVAAFADALREARQSADMTQEDLADRAGVSVRFISFLETGKRQPSISALAAVSGGLGLTMSTLIKKVEERHSAADQASRGSDNDHGSASDP